MGRPRRTPGMYYVRERPGQVNEDRVLTKNEREKKLRGRRTVIPGH